MNKYDALKKEYPKFVSKEQLCKICGIAKDTAWIYLQSGVIPCRDTGKKTRRYSICIEDVIAFLEKRDKGQVPPRSELKYYRPRPLAPLPEIKETDGYRGEVKRYFSSLLNGSPDVVTPREMAEIVGLSQAVIQRHILHGKIHAAIVGRGYKISKENVLVFMLSSCYQDGKGCSEKYKAIMEGLAGIEGKLQQAREVKRMAQRAFDTPEVQFQLDRIIHHYRNLLHDFPEIMTVNDLKTLFDKPAKFILPLLKENKIRSAKVDGRHMIPRKSVVGFLEGASFRGMPHFHQHLWIRINT